MKEIDVIPSTLAALRKMKSVDYGNKVRPCYAVFHDSNWSGKDIIFNHSTSRQMNKYMYMNPGALKRGIRAFLEYEVYNIVKNTNYGFEERDHLSSKQIDEVMNYLFDNKIIEIVYPLEVDEYDF